MATSPTPRRVTEAGKVLGEQLRAWRMLLDLPAEVVAERAGINRGTLTRLERGEVSVGLETFLRVAAALGVVDAIVKSTDPFDTDFGRARSDQRLPKRIRR